jgi:hypothetical protein
VPAAACGGPGLLLAGSASSPTALDDIADVLLAGGPGEGEPSAEHCVDRDGPCRRLTRSCGGATCCLSPGLFLQWAMDPRSTQAPGGHVGPRVTTGAPPPPLGGSLRPMPLGHPDPRQRGASRHRHLPVAQRAGRLCPTRSWGVGRGDPAPVVGIRSAISAPERVSAWGGLPAACLGDSRRASARVGDGGAAVVGAIRMPVIS